MCTTVLESTPARPPISLERVQWGGEGVVHYRAKGGHDGRTLPAGDAAEAFDPAEFVARVIMHIPEPLRHLVRYYGWYSNVCQARRPSPPSPDSILTAAVRAGCVH
jgi:hypothetical protein